MPSVWRKTGGSWVKIKTVYRKTGGSWQSVRRIWRKTAGAWQLVFQQSITPDIQTQVEITLTTANSTTQTKKLTGKLYHWTNASGVTYNFAKGSGDNLPATFTNISGASGTSTNPASGSSNTSDTYTLTQSDMIQNATNWFIYVSKATNSTYGTEQTSASYPVTFDMPRDIYTLATGTITRNSIALSWTPTVGSGSYAVYYGTSPSPTTLFTTTTASSVTVTGLSQNTLYYFRVLPWTGSSGNGYYGSYSNEVSAQTPVAPGNLTSVQHFNFTGNNLQLFLTTGTNTNSIQYKFIPTTFSGFEIGPFTQSVTSSRPYKFEHNLMSYFTLKTWNEDTYLSTTRYYQYNTAWYAGNEYQAKLVSFSGVSTAPSIGASNRYWTLGTIVGTYPYTPHTWSSGNTYTQGNTVYYGSTVFNSPVYQYTANDPGFEAVTPTNTSYWTKITTVNYNKGDYIYRASTSTYYFAKDSFNGFYPTNTTYWQSNYLLWYAQITPYNNSVDGNMYDTSGTYVTIINANGEPSERLTANIDNAAPTFSSITQTTASAKFTPNAANRALFYLRTGTSGGTGVSGYNPLSLTITPYTEATVNISGLTQNTDYNADVMARYMYNETYGIYHDGFTTASGTFKTLAPTPVTPTSLVTKSFSANQGTIFFTAQSNTGSVQGWFERTYFIGGVENVDSITNYVNATNGDANKILITGSNSNTATYTAYVQAWSGANKTGTTGTLTTIESKTLNGADAMTVSGFTLSSSSNTSLTITWNGTGAVNKYRARLYKSSDSSLIEDKGYNLTSGSATFNSLTQGTNYYVVVNPRYEYTSSVYQDGTEATSGNFATTSPAPSNSSIPTLSTDTNNYSAGSVISIGLGTWSDAASYKKELLVSTSTPVPTNAITKTLDSNSQYTITPSDASSPSYYFRAKVTAYYGANQTGTSTIAYSDTSSRSYINPSTSINVGTATSSGFTISGTASPVSGGSAYVTISAIKIYNSSQTLISTITTGMPTVDSITGAWSYVWSGGSGGTTYYAKATARATDSAGTTADSAFSTAITTSTAFVTPTWTGTMPKWNTNAPSNFQRVTTGTANFRWGWDNGTFTWSGSTSGSGGWNFHIGSTQLSAGTARNYTNYRSYSTTQDTYQTVSGVYRIYLMSSLRGDVTYSSSARYGSIQPYINGTDFNEYTGPWTAGI